MQKARLFYNGEDIIVTAEEVLNGMYDRSAEFVDAEYPEYRVRFVSSSKCRKGETIGIPYFRLYYSYEQYKSLYPDRADKYEMVANMRHVQESEWHLGWKAKVSSFCDIEKYFVIDKKRRFADAFNPITNTCIEFQHSYASKEFEDRNVFYSSLGMKMIWLFHLPKAVVIAAEDGNFEILEDNARGFFRAAYESDFEFKNVKVYIQVKSRHIYKVSKLFRRENTIEGMTATRLYFSQEGDWDEEGCLNVIKMGCDDHDSMEEARTISQLWNNDYKYLQLYNVETEEKIYVYHDFAADELLRSNMGCVLYKRKQGSEYYNFLRKEDERAAIWKPIRAHDRVNDTDLFFENENISGTPSDQYRPIKEIWHDSYDYMEIQEEGSDNTVFIYYNEYAIHREGTYLSIAYKYDHSDKRYVWMSYQQENASVWKPIRAELKTGEIVDFIVK